MWVFLFVFFFVLLFLCTNSETTVECHVQFWHQCFRKYDEKFGKGNLERAVRMPVDFERSKKIRKTVSVSIWSFDSMLFVHIKVCWSCIQVNNKVSEGLLCLSLQEKKKSHSGFPIASHDVISSGNCGFVKKHLGWNPDGCAAEDQRQGLPCSVKGWFEATDQVEQDPPAFLCCGNTKPWPFLALLLAVLALSSWAGRRLQDGVGASVAAWQGT